MGGDDQPAGAPVRAVRRAAVAGHVCRTGDPLVELIVTDVDGKAVADRPVKAWAVRLAWEFVDGSWQEVEKDEQSCDVTSGTEPVKCRFETGTGGEYRISAGCVTTRSGSTAASLRAG